MPNSFLNDMVNTFGIIGTVIILVVLGVCAAGACIIFGSMSGGG